nr:hypothetical protein [Sphingobacterium sp. FBM7-1]
MRCLLIGIVTSIVVIFSSCNNNPTLKVQDNTYTSKSSNTNTRDHNAFEMGDVVPSEEVCMVNNAYMGKKQFEVNFEGKIYYGCCQMCKERIPKDPSTRVAIDPFSKKQIDKATAIIAITGNNGEVSYFENNTTYTNYINQF